MTIQTPRPAATVVILRDRLPAGSSGGFDVFMVRRHEGAAFFAGAHVFPGGRVERPDAMAAAEQFSGVDETASRFPDLGAREATQFQVAAVRELFEETGILLARTAAGCVISTIHPDEQARFTAYRVAVHRGERSLWSVLEDERLQLALDTLTPLAHWVTPEIESRRFDTRFFVARMPRDQEPIHDTAETTDGVWIGAEEALERCRREEIILPPPTWSILKDLARRQSVDEVLAWARSRPIVRIEPRFVRRDGLSMLLLPGDPLYPAPTSSEIPEETRFVLEEGRWKARRA